jgi:FtsP/CotA-like multicopper oxidase with cupredoxin domain
MDVIPWEVEPGIVREAYAFNGTVPGPVIRVTEGDRLRFVVTNNLPEHTAVHWHGMVLPNSQDGVPGMTQEHIMPGETFTYEWTAVTLGTHWYHSHMGGGQVGRGLFGSLEVVPRSGDLDVDRDYRLLIGDGSLGFTFNGKSFPATVPLQARVGETVRIRLIGTGPEQIHPIHLHGMAFEVIAQDGHMLDDPYVVDTLSVAPGQTFDILARPTRPGQWMLHCHIFSHSEGPNGMTGLVTVLNVSS